MSQVQMAGMLGVSKMTVQQVENEVLQMSNDLVNRVAYWTGCKVIPDPKNKDRLAVASIFVRPDGREEEYRREHFEVLAQQRRAAREILDGGLQGKAALRGLEILVAAAQTSLEKEAFADLLDEVEQKIVAAFRGSVSADDIAEAVDACPLWSKAPGEKVASLVAGLPFLAGFWSLMSESPASTETAASRPSEQTESGAIEVGIARKKGSWVAGKVSHPGLSSDLFPLPVEPVEQNFSAGNPSGCATRKSEGDLREPEAPMGADPPSGAKTGPKRKSRQKE